MTKLEPAQYLGIWLIPMCGFDVAEALSSADRLTQTGQVLTHAVLVAVVFASWWWCLTEYIRSRNKSLRENLVEEIFHSSRAVQFEGDTYLLFPTDYDQQEEIAATNRSVSKIVRMARREGVE